MIFVDTNYFLRLLIDDESDQHVKSKKFFERAAIGKIKIFSTTIVFFEIFWVLSSFYKKKKSFIVKTLTNLLKMNFIGWKERDLLIEAVELFSIKNIELEDCFNLMVVKRKKVKKIASFDNKFQKVWREVVV